MTKTIQSVHIGEVKIAKGSGSLKSILGSCVGIGLIWRERKICGLAHCLLPQSKEVTFAIGAHFVNQAVPSLMAMMRIRSGDEKEVRAVLAGGGNMTHANPNDPETLIGQMNVVAARHALGKAGIKIIHEEVGGEQGRKITLHSPSGDFQIERIPRFTQAA